MKIYVAASWHTAAQPLVVELLRQDGHTVYDFREDGFSWQEVSPYWRTWTPAEYRVGLLHPRAQEGFKRDYHAMLTCHAAVLVQPCGRSAHLELGWLAGRGKYTVVLLEENQEPDLMYLLANARCVSVAEVREKLKEHRGEMKL